MSDDLLEECHSAMLHDNMNISLIMFHAQQVEEIIIRRKNRESKMVKSYEGGSSKGKFEILLQSISF